MPAAVMKLTDEAAETLWERVASRILKHEDEGHEIPDFKKLWDELHEAEPALYGYRPPDWNILKSFETEEFKAYLAHRRQQHYLVTMPTRLQVMRYYRAISERAGNVLMERLIREPDSFSNKDLVSILKDSVGAVGQLEKEVHQAAGSETGNTINLNYFEFLDKLPANRAHMVARSIAKELPVIEFPVRNNP